MRRPRPAPISICLLALTLAPGAAGAGPIEDLQPGQWYRVPNSKLSSVLPSPIPPGITGPGSVVAAWSGAAYDSRRDRLVVWGGGHQDYGGNELYAFDVNTLSWSRVWGPSTAIPPVNGSCNEAYSDGNPSSRHTYDGLEYIPTIDRFWAWGGSLYCGSGRGGYWTWTFDFDQGSWQHRADPAVAYASLEQVTDFDPQTGHVFLADPGDGLSEYNPITNTWAVVKNGGIAYGQTGALDHRRRKFVTLGGGIAQWYDLSPGGAATPRTLSTSGAREIESATYPGVVYDPVSDQIVAWSGGTNVYTLNLDTLVWTRRPAASGNIVVPPAAGATGTLGRFRYIPSRNAFIVVTGIDQDVYLYKLSPGGGAPADVTPPAPLWDVNAR